MFRLGGLEGGLPLLSHLGLIERVHHLDSAIQVGLLLFHLYLGSLNVDDGDFDLAEAVQNHVILLGHCVRHLVESLSEGLLDGVDNTDPLRVLLDEMVTRRRKNEVISAVLLEEVVFITHRLAVEAGLDDVLGLDLSAVHALKHL